jgi:hypothetical protein
MRQQDRKAVPKKASKRDPKEDDFISVARRLGADEDKATFEAKLAKIVKQKPQKK